MGLALAVLIAAVGAIALPEQAAYARLVAEQRLLERELAGSPSTTDTDTESGRGHESAPSPVLSAPYWTAEKSSRTAGTSEVWPTAVRFAVGGVEPTSLWIHPGLSFPAVSDWRIHVALPVQYHLINSHAPPCARQVSGVGRRAAV